MYNFKKNDIISLDITDLTSEGSGIGHIDGLAVFVPNTVPGDSITCRIIKTSKNYLVGKTETLIAPSDDRIVSDCAAFPQCGGCSFRELSYEAELRAKQKRVQDCLTRIAGISPELVHHIVPAQKTDQYRCKVLVPVTQGSDGKLMSGFYASRSHRVIPCDCCLLHSGEIGQVLRSVLSFFSMHSLSAYDETTGKGLLRAVYIRASHDNGTLMVCPVLNADCFPLADEFCTYLHEHHQAVSSVYVHFNERNTNVSLGGRFQHLAGDRKLYERVCGKTFALSPASFFQINPAQAEILYTLARKSAALKQDERLLDLYCGTGSIGITMSDDCGQLIGVESVCEAVEDAKENAEINHVKNAEFLCADAAQAAVILADRQVSPDVIVVDPPRKGCDRELLSVIYERFCPKRIVYVSCDPATLARDCAVLTQNGYRFQSAVPVDLFPRTVHVETVVLMSRVSNEPR